jgi:hypothetical protein
MRSENTDSMRKVNKRLLGGQVEYVLYLYYMDDSRKY